MSPTAPLLVLPVLLVAALAACADAPVPSVDPEDRVTPDSAIAAVPYLLADPDTIAVLPDDLEEISGLAVGPGGALLAVQDEDGLLFEIDPSTGAIVGRRPFYDEGDYEGVEAVGDDVWVVESDGDLYRLAPGADVAERTETGLGRRSDVEGLGLDPATGHLLLACKEHPGGDLDGGRDGVRAIWAFDPATGTLGDEPAYVLPRAELDATGPPYFKPSAVAVHPTSGDLYVLSSVRKALVVVSSDGTLRAAIALPPRLYPQPEGIAFGADGTLTISNEGAGGSATLLRFSEQPL